MSLATVIRLEFAYPGVGVLAGDSLQYLSIATGHGVIMVFFMIMPTIFGAFGNFLLPTQLGVHDVAFPRLNSAAFWFLPGGLLMLCQLVCTDRRYQRMNCFNIRELQGILKRRFFTDLVNSSDYREIMDSSMIGLRYKNNNNLNLNHDALSFYNLGTTNSSKFRNSELLSTYAYTSSNFGIMNQMIQTDFSLPNLAHSLLLNMSHLLNSLYNLIISLKVTSILSLFSSSTPSYLFSSFFSNFNFSYASLLNFNFTLNTPSETSTVYTSSKAQKTSKETLYTNLESSSEYRYNKFSNPVISYDYKCGHYLGI
jgi:hypothetical protein